MRRLRAPLLATLLAALLLPLAAGGCGGTDLGPLDPPELNVLGLRGWRLELLSATSTLRLRVSNPNPDPITLEGIRVELLAGGKDFAEGMGPLETEVAAYESAEVSLPVTISNLEILQTAKAVRGSKGKLSHGLNAKLTFAAGGERHTVRIEKAGELDLGFLRGATFTDRPESTP
jgi:LEA14-like dessication related protein